MLRKTSIAIAISIALAAAGSASSASASSVLKAKLLLVPQFTSQESGENAAEADVKSRAFCTPIPWWPWCW